MGKDVLAELLSGFMADQISGEEGAAFSLTMVGARMDFFRVRIEEGGRLLETLEAVGENLPESVQHDVKQYLGLTLKG